MSDKELYKILENFDNLDSATDKLDEVTEDDLNEAQTKVEKMGNKVRVTKDGDTTEFDDAETAAEFMDGDDEVNEDTEEVTEEDEVNEGIEDEWDIGGDEYDELAAYKDILPKDEPVVDFDADDMMGIEDDEFDLEEDEYGRDQGAMYDPWAGDDDDDDEEPEFATFDSENEAHRKRLQRGTPVVLSKELFSDPDVNRRGVFVNRSPSGHYGTVIRDVDGKEVNVHLSDIVSADLVNNSIYEEYNINFEEMLADDITMTQTTNLENPENDTTTVTAIGPDASEELAAIMANAGLNKGEYAPVDTGEPEPEVIDEPEAMLPAPDEVEEGWDEDDLFGSSWDDEGDVEPTDADLDAIEGDPEWDLGLDDDLEESRMSELDMVLNNFNAVQLQNWLENGDDEVDEALYEISIEDMPYGVQKARTGDPSEWLHDRYAEEVEKYLDDVTPIKAVEERDIEHANTPDEEIADVDVVTHGTSGGLNKPKRMYKTAGNRWGDNGMQADELDEDTFDGEELYYDAKTGAFQTRKIENRPGYEDPAAYDHVTDREEEVDEDVDMFMSVYKEFGKRGEKKG